ncbi:MAG: SMC-Scp complex subunit ScpB [Christensenellales bacterium]
MNDAQARGALEAILFVAGEAVQLEDLARALEMTVLECDGFIDRMAQQYLAEQRGVEIIRIEDKVQFRTSRQYAEQDKRRLPLSNERCPDRCWKRPSLYAARYPQ